MSAFSGYDKTRLMARIVERRVLFARLQEGATHSRSRPEPSMKDDPKPKDGGGQSNGQESSERPRLLCLPDSLMTTHPALAADKWKKQVCRTRPEDGAPAGGQARDEGVEALAGR